MLVRLTGHGDGWQPSVPGTQPSGHDTQPGGFLWDDHPGSSFNTPELSRAFEWAYQQTGRQVDLLYLDACLMGAAPIAQGLHPSVKYLLASESLEYTGATPIQADIAAINNQLTPAQLGELWLQNGSNLLTPGGYPHTYSLIDLSQIQAVRTAQETLANLLIPTLPDSKEKLAATWTTAGCFDSNGNNFIESQDNLCDLRVWAGEVITQFNTSPTIINAAATLQEAIEEAVIAEAHHNGVFYKSGQSWVWGALGGLSDYLPLRQDDWKRAFYPADAWRDLLNAYWANIMSPPAPTCTTGHCPPPLPPAQVALRATARPGYKTIQIEWDTLLPVPSLYQYQVYRRPAGKNWSRIASTTLAHYTDKDEALQNGIEYCYQIKAVNSFDTIIGESNVTCATYGMLSLWIPAQVAPPAAQGVLVPINLENGNNLCIAALDVVVDYNPAIVIANGTVLPTPYTQGYTFAANTSKPGQVKVSAIAGQQCVTLYGPGSLFELGFNVLGNEGQVSPLDFITGLTGTVIYASGNLQTPVPLNLSNGSLTIANTFMRGDINGDGAVNAADAQMALLISVGAIVPTPQQSNACDMNGDKTCSAADVSLILCYAAYQNWEMCMANTAN